MVKELNSSAGIIEIKDNPDYVLLGYAKEGLGKLMGGYWHLPGGKSEPGEDPKKTLYREIKEETNLDIQIKRLLDETRAPDGYMVNWFLAETDNKYFKAGSDLERLVWARKDFLYDILDEKIMNMWPDSVKEYLGITSSMSA